MKGHIDEPELPAPSSTARNAGGIAALMALVVLAWSYPFAVGAAAVLAGVLFMHELGHYAAARAVGMKVTDFFLGFGPRLWSFRRGETSFGLRALPLGAYVRIIGMSRSEPVEPGDESRAYRTQTYPRRLLVVSAGSLMHLCLALVAFGVVHAALGAPARDGNNWQVAEVITQRDGVTFPADAAGILAGDRIVNLNGADTEEWDVFVSQVQSRPGERVSLEIERDGVLRTVEAELATDPGTGSGLLGVRPEWVIVYETVGLPTAAVLAFTDLGRSIVDSVRGIWGLFANFGDVVDRIVSAPGDPSANSNLGMRPLGIYGIVDLASDTSWGWSERALMFALVNVFLGVFNMLPLPPFDGGHVAVATYERWRERGGRGRYLIDPSKLAPLATVVVAALALLAVGLLYLDIANPVDL
ncbi:M50 family metallopeptidase [Candidatus Poriferisodalis sp.]|uniref:M50 family metallopeptidase n=1 Tax=Candidatus Poriferisodalis sp. TaxID=3101277 RepID=UPI003B517750